jgi:hypothetical protein
MTPTTEHGREPGAIAAGPLDAEGLDPSQLLGPVRERHVTTGVCRKGAVLDPLTRDIHGDGDGDVDVLVRVDADDDPDVVPWALAG